MINQILDRILSPFRIVSAMVVVVFKRIRHNLGISLSAILGIVAVLSIVVAVPVFSHAVSSKVLRSQLEEKAALSNRKLLSQHIYHIDPGTSMTLEKADAITSHIKNRYPDLMGLDVEDIILETQTVNLAWNSLEPKGSPGSSEPWLNMNFFYLDHFAEQVEVIEGTLPAAISDPSAPIQVSVLESAADKYYLNIGDRFESSDLVIEITAIVRPINDETTVWFDQPDTAYENRLYVPKETYRQVLQKTLTKPVFFASWYIISDEDKLDYARAPQYARGLVRLDSELRQLLPDITSDYSPLEAFIAYQDRAESLTTLIYAVSGPMVIMALLFITLTATISVQQYEQETATMRGRGSSWGQVVALNLIESVLLIVIAIPLALLMGWLAVTLMGRTETFLQFTSRAGVDFAITGLNIGWLLLGALLVIVSRFLPMLNVSRTTIVRVKQEQTRSTKKPFWQRFYLDFLLLLPGIYAYFNLRGFFRSTRILPSLELTAGQPYRDPILFLAPSLFAIGLCMISMRILPWLVKILSKFVERLPGIWAYLSIQQIARRPQDHTNALLLIMISLSLAIFSASTAKTLDKWMYDSVYYSAGSDLGVHEFVVEGGDPAAFSPGASSSVATVSDLDLNVQGYVSLEDHLSLPSIEGAARVGKYEGTFSYGVGELPAIFMGIDRIELPSVAFYRDDFANQPLGGLMNDLGVEPMGVLVQRSLAEENGFQIGDRLNASINIIDQSVEREYIITGFYDYFPTVYPVARPTLIVNLESIFDNPDAVIGYDIWLKLRQDTSVDVLLHQIRQLMGVRGAVVKVNGDGMFELQRTMVQPERLGVFGILNVGFLVTGLMPGIGFILYSYASLRRRFIQLGILQAIGMSVRQLIGYLTLEQFLLMGLAILSGAAVGILTSYIFVPLLQVGASGGGVAIPPFEVLIGWNEAIIISLVFGGVLVLTILGTIFYLVRIKVFQAVKMGESL